MTTRRPIEFCSGPVGYGSGDFTVRLGASSWKCCASYLGAHPLRDLILVAVDIYDHIFGLPLPEESAVWEAIACDEPGGLKIRMVPTGWRNEVHVAVFRLPDDPFVEPGQDPERTPLGEAELRYWDLADAIFTDAARTVARHGFTGFRQHWELGRWDADAHYESLPIEHFLYLASLVEKRPPSQEKLDHRDQGLSLDEEIRILREIRKKFPG